MKDFIKDQALKACIDIFKAYHKEDAPHLTKLMNKAWHVGRQAADLHIKKLQTEATEPCRLECVAPPKDCCDFEKPGVCQWPR